MGRLPDGRVVFVPFGAPDEVVEISLQQNRKTYARGLLREVLRPSPDRVRPACPLAAPDLCGGCPLMHLSETSQHRAKHAWVCAAVRHTGALVLPLLSPTPALAYRLRTRMQLIEDGLSFAQARSEKRCAVSACPVLMPALGKVLFDALRSTFGFMGLGATVAAVCGNREGLPAVGLSIKPGQGAHTAALISALGRLVSDSVVIGAQVLCTQLGQTEIELDRRFGPLLTSPAGFAQASQAGHSVLPKLVSEQVSDGLAGDGSVLELFAGSGNLTRALHQIAGSVVAVEGESCAAKRLSNWAQDKSQVVTLAVSVAEALARFERKKRTFDVAVLDPPRTGARETIAQLARLTRHRVVYVSCDVMTLARDIVEFRRHGFFPKTVQPLDLMPQTAEIECVAVLDRA